jgi:hypothetical protein
VGQVSALSTFCPRQILAELPKGPSVCMRTALYYLKLISANVLMGLILRSIIIPRSLCCQSRPIKIEEEVMTKRESRTVYQNDSCERCIYIRTSAPVQKYPHCNFRNNFCCSWCLVALSVNFDGNNNFFLDYMPLMFISPFSRSPVFIFHLLFILS